MKLEASPKNIEQLKSLVEGFRTNLRSLHEPQTLEAVIRQEYIDPFWKLLEWDVANAAHRSRAEKDVVIEAPVATIEAERIRSRRPDYLFRIDGFPRFVIEAKKPSVDLHTDKDAIFQAKTYAWSAQIPFVILTDFEEFRLFDATIKPDYNAPQRGLVVDFDLRFEDYVTQWDILYNTFSRSAVAGGSLEALLAKIKHIRAGRRIRGIDRMLIDIRGTEPVDRVFLKHLEDYRLRFARALFAENRAQFPEADTRHGAAKLTEATQRLIDRLVFMRVCEDRNITTYGRLRELINKAVEDRLDLYPELAAEFRNFDRQYNGYLFKPHFSEQLKIHPEILVEFIGSLYPPDGPYRFEAIGDDILGIIYERFLGSAITVERNDVEAEEKPEVRHAGGVYYTPRFVVDAIVRRVVGPKIKDKSPLEILDVKILDPACGSGSFLIAALQHLYDHCTRYITANPAAAVVPASPRAKTKKKAIAFKDKDGNWDLSPEFRGQLLASCMFGVDIDAQAVEVTIMSLYLKMLECKNWQREFLQIGLLPSLDNNICCGNSLLSQADFDRYWEDKNGGLFGGDEDLKFRINAFDWTSQTRGFGRILENQKGFDCIIGNPPYIRVQELNKWSPEECEFYKFHYKSAAKGNYDIYVVFIERALQLLAPDGLLGFICPHKFWQTTYGQGIRKIIADGKHLHSIIDFADQQVFAGATTYTAIHVFSKKPKTVPISFARISELTDGDAQCSTLDSGQMVQGVTTFEADHPQIDTAMWSFTPRDAFKISLSPEKKCFRLADIVEFSQGFKTGADGVFVVEFLQEKNGLATIRSTATENEHKIETSILRPLIKSEHMRRFEIRPTSLALIFPYLVKDDTWRILKPEELAKRYPKAWSNYLQPVRSILDKRESGRFSGTHFYQYSRQQNFVPLLKTKLVTPDMADHMRFSFDKNGEFVFSGGAAGGVCVIPNDGIDPLFLMGILNSAFIENQVRQKNGVGFRGGYLNCEIRFLRDIPIQLPNSKIQKQLAAQIVERVQRIIDAKAALNSAKISDRQTQQLQREIEAHENKINELVCRLYDVSEILA